MESVRAKNPVGRPKKTAGPSCTDSQSISNGGAPSSDPKSLPHSGPPDRKAVSCFATRKEMYSRKHAVWKSKGRGGWVAKRRGRKSHRLLFAEPDDEENVQPLSEYELTNMRRREELLAMLRSMCLIEPRTLKEPEKKEYKRKKYGKRPLPPLRPRSLRLQGLAPGQRPLRRRRHSVGPKCFCCCLASPEESVVSRLTV